MTNVLRTVSGVWPATLTPFLPDGRIDEATLASHVSEVSSVRGVQAVMVNGHAGEATSLSRDERALIVRRAVSAAGQIPVIAGIVTESAVEACVQAQDAAQAGARGLVLFPPALFAQGVGTKPEMATKFVRAVARACGLPIVLFQLSHSSGLAYSTTLLVQLCREVREIVAIKEGSDVPQRYEDNLRALHALDRPVAVLTTNNSWLMASLAYGGDGILSGLGSVAASLLVELYEAMSAGRLDQARKVNDQLTPLCRAFYRAPFFDAHSRMKTALSLMGKLPHPEPRGPLLPIAAAEREEIRGALVAAGLLGEEARSRVAKEV